MMDQVARCQYRATAMRALIKSDILPVCFILGKSARANAVVLTEILIDHQQVGNPVVKT